MKKYLVQSIVSLLIVLLFLVGCSGTVPSQSAVTTAPITPKTSSSAPKITLKFNTWMPVGTGHPDMQMAQWLFDEIKKRTNGQVEFQVFPSNQLATQAENIDGIKNGLFDAGHYLASATPGKAPLWTVEWQPLALSDDPTIAIKTKRELGKLPFMQQELAQWNAQYFWGCASGPRVLMVKKEIRTLADLKGVKIRSTGGEANVFQSLGATPISVDTSGMYDAIQKGTIDGATNTFENLVSYGISEVTKSAILLNLGMGSPIILINQKIYTNLPPDLQKIVTDTTVEGDVIYGNFIKDRLAKSLGEAQKAGKQTLITPAPEEQKKWNDAAQVVTDAWIKQQDSKGLPGTDAIKNWISIQQKLISAK